MPVYASGKCINRSTATYFAESDAGVQPVHKIVNVDSQLRIQRVQPLGQILFHRDQILLRGLERPVRPRFQKHRHAASTIPETSIDRHFSTSTHMFTKYFHICANYSLLLSYLFWRNLFINVNKDYFIDLFATIVRMRGIDLEIHLRLQRYYFIDTNVIQIYRIHLTVFILMTSKRIFTCMTIDVNCALQRVENIFIVKEKKIYHLYPWNNFYRCCRL